MKKITTARVLREWKKARMRYENAHVTAKDPHEAVRKLKLRASRMKDPLKLAVWFRFLENENYHMLAQNVRAKLISVTTSWERHCMDTMITAAWRTW